MSSCEHVGIGNCMPKIECLYCEIKRLCSALAVMTAAKDEACDLVSRCLDTLSAYPAYEEPGAEEVENRLAELRKIEAK